ncbi:hypothetical protein QR680_015288 [Steinernema hermaphroditum]|uniref:Uncharacterized protein n=1 Tax=Steinernema hermaphroditum TaxID=289476 RepID=A0AA39H9S5_9BILA|nr:hypothetical protein QR680_015288 [Steinernema hermaphroditum]
MFPPIGWYRECTIIPHTTDFDIALFSPEYKPDLLEQLKHSKDFSLFWTLGSPSDQFEISVFAENVKIDIFVLYSLPETRQIFMGGTDLQNKERLIYMYPEFKKVCTADMLGRLMFVPCDPTSIIKTDYGSKWDIDHDTNKYLWNSSPTSIYNKTKLTDQELRTIVTCYAEAGC